MPILGACSSRRTKPRFIRGVLNVSDTERTRLHLLLSPAYSQSLPRQCKGSSWRRLINLVQIELHPSSREQGLSIHNKTIDLSLSIFELGIQCHFSSLFPDRSQLPTGPKYHISQTLIHHPQSVIQPADILQTVYIIKASLLRPNTSVLSA
jgi:hypothetical protein